ncbi:MAG TPA: molybdenum cofactor guanylyltransferase [Symbiobacteriaceae bacterium]|nr:molybdenum cofactor guanylyltransferase [Symbiobacteriaceae bacterium]
MDKQIKACGVILAGGQSSRMGVNKALLDFGGEPLIGRVARQFTAWFDQVVVVTNSPEQYAFLGLPMAGDRIPGLGPLGGLEAGLTASRFEHAFFAACDMPFLNEGLIRYLLDAAPDHDIVVPRVGGEFEPMHAVYTRSCLPAITANLEARRLKLLRLFDAVRVRVVEEPEIRPFGAPERLFFNCNTPEDLAQARTWEREA